MSDSSPIVGALKRTASRAESKLKNTDTVSRSIIDAEVNAREAKTARLRAARLAMEATAEEAPAPVKRKPVRKVAAKKA